MNNIVYVLYSIDRDIWGYYHGKYRFQGAWYGAFDKDLKRARGNNLKTYTTLQRAESALEKIRFENADKHTLEIRKVDLETFEVLKIY